jgi:hypothetical protein
VYNQGLDQALVGLIHASCDNSPDSRIDTYTVRGADEDVQLGSTLYAKLKKALTLNDAVKLAGLQDRVHTVRLYNRDVVRLGKELDAIWNDGARLGKRFDEDLKKSTLYRCTAQDWFYANTVDALKTARPDCKYEEAYHALAKKQQDGEFSGRIRGAARVATGSGQFDPRPSMQAPRGRRDPQNPSALSRRTQLGWHQLRPRVGKIVCNEEEKGNEGTGLRISKFQAKNVDLSAAGVRSGAGLS